MDETERYKLTYFNKRGGGEIIRLVFAAAGVQYEDERLDTEQWYLFKPDTPMGNVPLLTISKPDCQPLVVCQAAAIARHLSQKYGLHGQTEFQTFLIDEVYGCVGDVRQKLTQIYFCKDDDTKEELKRDTNTVLLPKFNLYLDKRMQAFGQNGYIVGNKLSLADLAVFNMVDSCVEMGWASLWNPYPNILKHRELVLENPRISQWTKTRPKTLV